MSDSEKMTVCYARWLFMLVGLVLAIPASYANLADRLAADKQQAETAARHEAILNRIETAAAQIRQNHEMIMQNNRQLRQAINQEDCGQIRTILLPASDAEAEAQIAEFIQTYRMPQCGEEACQEPMSDSERLECNRLYADVLDTRQTRQNARDFLRDYCQ
ncbi:MAG: hypothetical protein AAFP10_07715 [Pseudomonadota bacterium]